MDKPANCYHCGEPVPDGPPIVASLQGVDRPMCCIGCKAVAEFIDASGFNKFYEYRDAPGADLNLTPEARDWSRFDAGDMRNRYVHVDGDSAEATIDIGGMYCSACVWLFDKALARIPAIESADVNPATHRAVVRWDDGALAFSDVLGAIAGVGFRPAPVAPGEPAGLDDEEHRAALRRLIVAAAAGMQVMMFAVALYAGDYFGIEGDIATFLRYLSLLLAVPIVFYAARPFFAGAWRGIRSASPGMDLPVSIAILAAFTASAIATWRGSGEIYFDSVAMFVLFLGATRFLEMRARHRSEDHARALAQLLPDTALRIAGGRAESVLVDQLRPGDLLGIRPGDVLPADGRLQTGELSLDESMLTGESLPVERQAGSEVLAGAIVRRGNAEVEVLRTGASTSLAEIGRMLERARADRPPVALLADRIASRFVVGVLALASAAWLFWWFEDRARAFDIALATLVVTCPCALSLATPAAIAAATARLARSGFLVVRSRVIEVLNHATVIVFDKTGTLTRGRPVVMHTEVLSGDSPAARLLGIAALIETASEHVLARAFAPFRGSEPMTPGDVAVTPGQGVEATVDGTRYRVGAASFAASLPGTDSPDSPASGGTSVWLSDERSLLARFDIGDELRDDAGSAIRQLRSLGFRPVIASGDRQAAVADVASALGIDDWHAALSPSGKLDLVREIRAGGDTVVMVGDGINDAPVLAAADASIALDAGTALARASADAVSLGRRLGTIVTAANLARQTRRIIRQNLAWAIVYNVTAVPLAVSGALAPWMAAIGMSASSLIVVLNALRLHRDSRLPADRAGLERQAAGEAAGAAG